MPDTDPLDLLRAADPFTEDSAPQPKSAPDSLFDRITTTSFADPLSTGTIEHEAEPTDSERVGVDSPSAEARRSRRRWSRSIAMPAAAAIAGLVVGGAVLLNPGSTPSASALVAEAAATSAAFDSGRVVMDIDIVESPGDEASGRFSLDYRFDGGDYWLLFDGSQFDASTDETGAPNVLVDMDLRGVGDRMYSSFDEPGSFFAGPRRPGTETTEELFGFQPTSMEPATVVALLEQTDDFDVVTSDDGKTTYRGSVTVAAVEALGPDSLPAGLSMLADPGISNDDLPDTLGVDVVVRDGLLDTVTIEIDGDSQLGYTQGSITTTFSELGEPQDIVAPPDDQISDEVMGGLPEGFDEALATLDELDGRRPELCSDTFGDPSAEVSGEELVAQIEAFAVCLEEAGEPAAADAFRSISDFGD